MLSTNLLSLISLSLVALANGKCDEKMYTCLDDETKVQIYDMVLSCPVDQVCNDRNIAPCGPCINKTERCGFGCQDGNVVIHGVLAKCPENYICNSEQTADCNYCTREKCPTTIIKNFMCDREDKSKLNIFGIEAQCDTGYECNENFVEPCDPCIETIDFEEVPITNENEVTTTESVSTTEGDFEDVSTTKEIEVTTTEEVQVTTEVNIPNCNDGLAFFKPCRAGNSGVYFKCKSAGWFKYNTERKDCNDLENDSTCKNVKGLCQ